MKLKELLHTLCIEHGLSSISVDFHIYGEDHVGYGSYAHWHNNSGKCASGNGDTPEIAIAQAIANANAIRAIDLDPVDVITVEDFL